MTKGFADGCSSHIKDTYFRQSNLLVPDAPGAFVMENVELRGPDYWQILTGILWLRRAVDVRRRHLAAGVRVAKRLRVRRLLDRDASRGATLPTHRIRDFSPAPPCAFAY